MNPTRPKAELLASTRLRKGVSGDSLNSFREKPQSFTVDLSLKRAISSIQAMGLAIGLSTTFLMPAGLGATYTTDFNSGQPVGSSIYGTSTVDPTGGVNDSGVLKLTLAQNTQNGSFIIDDFDSGQPVSSFTARFKALVGGGTATPAEGFSLNFSDDLPDATWGSPQLGQGNGLSVLFQLFNVTGLPKLIVRFKGADVAETVFNSFGTGTNFVDVLVKLDLDGSLDVVYNGIVVYTNLFAYTPIAGRFGFGGNTGNQNANMWIDDLNITTATLAAPFVKSVVPTPVNASPVTPVKIEIADMTTAVVLNTVTMKFNGQSVVPTTTKDGDTTTVFYDPPGLLPAGSTNLVQVTYSDDSSPAKASTVQFEFVVAKVVIVPANYATASATVDKTKPGFKVRVVQARSDASLPPTLDRTEKHLDGVLIDPVTSAPYVNEADPTGADAAGFFVDADVVNYDIAAAAAGNFSDTSTPPFPDELFPGIPSGAPNQNNLSIEIRTWLELKSGVHKMGVNSSDGFALRVGPNPLDFFAITLGSFNDPAGRTAADTTFDVFIEQDGIYPFRLLYNQGTGPASLEWFTINVVTGQKILVNDLSNPNAVKAFREGVRRPYVASVKPFPGAVGVQPKATIEIGIRDGDTQLVNNLVSLFLNGTSVQPTFAKPPGSLTTVTYNPAGGLLPANTVRVVYGDNATTPNYATNTFSFVLLPFLGNQGARLQDSGPDGLLVLEAEHFDRSIARAGLEWKPAPSELVADFSGDGGMQVTNTGLNINIDVSRSPELDYKVSFVKTGRHHVWVRGLAPDIEPGLAGGNDSVNTGLDGVLLDTSDRIVGFSAVYVWSKGTADGALPATIDITSTGEHHFNLFMREDGFIADKILITTSESYVPTELGPPESPREQVVVQPTLDVQKSGASLVISWPKDGTDGFILEQAASLSLPATWAPERTAVIESGGRKTVTVSASLQAQFYRLRHP